MGRARLASRLSRWLVLPGPDGGPVVVSEGLGVHAVPLSAVAAFRLDGRRRWLSASPWGCGNCSDGQYPPALQPDGRYGPVGPEGSGAWAVDQSGRRVDSCGAALADGTCITHTSRPDPQGTREFPVVVARRAGSTRGEYSEPQFPWTIAQDMGVPPRIVQDGAGGIYTSFGPVRDPRVAPLPMQLLALDRSTGALRWRVADASPQAGLASGVLATHTTGGLASRIRRQRCGALVDDGAAPRACDLRHRGRAT